MSATHLGHPDPADTRERAEIEHEVFKAGLVAGLGDSGPLPLDSHLHTIHSPDANAMLEAYCALALERGIDEIAITDHVDFDPSMPAYGFASFEDRERDVREAAARWADRGLAVRFGVEVTYERAYEDQIRGWLRRHPHDYVIGSVHISAVSPYKASNVATFVTGRTLPEIVAPYFDEVIGAARSGLFDTLGHLDFVKRYLVPHVMPARARRSPGAVRAGPRRADRDGDGAGGQRLGPAPAPAGDLSGPAHRCPLPRAGWATCDHRQRRPPNGVVRIWARGGVSSRDARGI